MARELNPKQRQFVYEYMIDYNAKKAAIRAGYSEKTAQVQSSRLLSLDKVKKLVHELEQKQINKLIADRNERLQVLTDIMRNPGKETRDRIKAVDVLNKMMGEYSEKVELNEGSITYKWENE